MLSSKYRFHGYGALKFLFGHGKTFRFKNLSLRIAQNKRRQNSRVAVIISKKVLKAAPKRNRVRRRVYEAIRTDWPNIKSGYDILISIYDANFAEADYETVIQELHQALKTARIWIDK